MMSFRTLRPMEDEMTETTWQKLPTIEGGPGGCAHCGYQHDALPMDAMIAVGFGDANLTRDGEVVWDERSVAHIATGWDDFWTVERAEQEAAKDPDHDWRIHLVAPLSERHYQRQGEKHWVLYEKGIGFA